MKLTLRLLLLALILAFVVFEVTPDNRVMSVSSDNSFEDFAALGKLNRLSVLYADKGGTIYGMDDVFVYSSIDGGQTFQQVGRIKKPVGSLAEKIKDMVARLRITRFIRGHRFGYNLVVLDSGTIVVFSGLYIYRSDDGGKTFESVLDLSADTIYSPFPFSPGVTVGPNDTVYFGEYQYSEDRPYTARIVKGTNDGSDWEIAYTFDSGQVWHVHSIYYDRYRNGYWICTGDSNDEAGLYWTDDDFESLVKVGGGSRDWRIVSLIITKDYLYWGSDNPDDGASIFRLDVVNNYLEEILHIGYVVYYSTMLSDGTMVLSTTFEPDSPFVQAQSPSPETSLWVSRDGANWKKILNLPHDWNKHRAKIAFPGGEPLPILYAIPINTLPHDLSTRVYKPNWD
jgi:hypothetical protein